MLLIATATATTFSLSPGISHSRHFEGVLGAQHKAASESDVGKRKWHVRAHRYILFHGNSASLSSADEHDLLLIARAAQVHTDYLLCVLGSADSGKDESASHLRNQRAQAAIHFLRQSGDVPADRLLSRARLRALGISVSNEHSESSSDPNGVEVMVLAH